MVMGNERVCFTRLQLLGVRRTPGNVYVSQVAIALALLYSGFNPDLASGGVGER